MKHSHIFKEIILRIREKKNKSLKEPNVFAITFLPTYLTKLVTRVHWLETVKFLANPKTESGDHIRGDENIENVDVGEAGGGCVLRDGNNNREQTLSSPEVMYGTGWMYSHMN